MVERVTSNDEVAGSIVGHRMNRGSRKYSNIPISRPRASHTM